MTFSLAEHGKLTGKSYRCRVHIGIGRFCIHQLLPQGTRFRYGYSANWRSSPGYLQFQLIFYPFFINKKTFLWFYFLIQILIINGIRSPKKPRIWPRTVYHQTQYRAHYPALAWMIYKIKTDLTATVHIKPVVVTLIFQAQETHSRNKSHFNMNWLSSRIFCLVSNPRFLQQLLAISNHYRLWHMLWHMLRRRLRRILKRNSDTVISGHNVRSVSVSATSQSRKKACRRSLIS